MWNGLADATIALHYGFLVYLLVGGFLAWRWPKTVVVHIVAAVWAVLIVTTSVPCPLTAAQNSFREHAGLPPLRDGFIELYVRGVIYPPAHELLAQALLAVVVVISWLGLVDRTMVFRHLRAAMR